MTAHPLLHRAMTRIASTATVLGLSLVSPTTMEAQDRLLEMSPESTMAVIGCNDFGDFVADFEPTTLDEFMASEKVQEVLGHLLDQMTEEFDSEFGVGFDFEELGWPSGLVGAALYAPTGEDELSETDNGFVFFAEFDESADSFAELFDLLIENAHEEDEVPEVEEIDYEGRVIFRLFEPEIDREARLDEIREWWDGEITEEDIRMFEESGMLDSDPMSIFLVNDEGMLIVANSVAAVKEALDRRDGIDLPSAATNERLTRALEVARGIDRRGTNDFYLAAGLSDEAMEFMRGLMTGAGAGPTDFDETMAVFDTLGIADVEGFGMVFRPGDGAVSIMETLFALTIDGEPDGVFNLVGAPTPFEPPSWIGAQVSAAYQFEVDFEAIVPLIRDVLKTMPEEVGPQASQMFETQAAETMTLVFETLGPSIYAATGSIDPETGEARSETVVGIECSDVFVVENVINQFAAMTGWTARDFTGFRLFDNEFVPVSIGLGKGFVFIGGTGGVEQALRADPDTPGLADEAAFDEAAALLPGEAVMYGFQPARQMVESIVYELKSSLDPELQKNEMREMFDQFEIDYTEEELDDMVATPEWYDEDMIPSVDELLRYIGGSITEMHFTRDGLVGVGRTLAPSARER
ncbi:MAG: hypothetical protein ACF8PN_04570 [Phycisphaerales bacterium]